MKTGLEQLVERLDYQIGFTAHLFAVDDLAFALQFAMIKEVYRHVY